MYPPVGCGGMRVTAAGLVPGPAASAGLVPRAGRCL